jgi:hypothetical protein
MCATSSEQTANIVAHNFVRSKLAAYLPQACGEHFSLVREKETQMKNFLNNFFFSK